MSAFMWYILGAVLTGFIFTVLTQHVDSFYSLLCNNIDKSKNDLKNSGKLKDDERILLDGLSTDSIINYMSWFLTIISWFGLLFVIFYILLWIINPDGE